MENEKSTQQAGTEDVPVTGGAADAEESVSARETGDAPTPTADAGQTEGEKPSFEELLRDPDYKRGFDAAVQGIVKARLRGRQQAEEKLSRLAPVLQALEEDYGLAEGADLDSLAARLRESAGFRRPEGGEIAAHLERLFAEAEALRESVPGFDLLRELEDPDFLRLTAPHSGVSLADAYFARHRLERERESARRSLEAVSRSVRSLGARPRELRETGAGGGFRNDPRSMSRQEREALKKRIREASARGERIRVE